MVNLWNNTRLNQMGGCSVWTEEWSRDLVTWCDYVKPVRILKRCANNFSCWDGILGRRPGGQVLQDHVSRRISSRMGMTLRSLETYGYIDSKTKSYQIKRGFLLLFIFFQTLAFRLHAFWPYYFGHMPSKLLYPWRKTFVHPNLLGS